jgi:hypothetical protein
VEYEVAPKPFLDLVSDDRVGMVLALVCGGGGVCPFVVFILALFESRVVLPSGHALGSSSTARLQRQDRVLPLPLIWHNDPLFTIALQPHP